MLVTKIKIILIIVYSHTHSEIEWFTGKLVLVKLSGKSCLTTDFTRYKFKGCTWRQFCFHEHLWFYCSVVSCLWKPKYMNALHLQWFFLKEILILKMDTFHRRSERGLVIVFVFFLSNSNTNTNTNSNINTVSHCHSHYIQLKTNERINI